MIEGQIVVERRHLPDDVLSIIRDYSKPVLKYFREYNSVLKVNYLEEWTTLKKKLTDNGENILPLLLSYQSAADEWYLAMKEERSLWESGYMGFNMMVLRQERARRHFVTQSKKYTMQKKLRDLTLEMYGIEKEPYEMRDKTRSGVWV
jgi:hypothetical protein